MLVLVSALGPAFLPYVALPMGLMLLSGGFVAWRKARAAEAPEDTREGAKHEVELRTPFALGPALKLTLLFFGILVLSQVMTLLFGSVGLLATAFFSGIVDECDRCQLGADVVGWFQEPRRSCLLQCHPLTGAP